MRSSWAQPSLSRDFALLSAAILFLLFLVSAWVTFTTYTAHAERINTEMEQEAKRIDRTLATEMENANYLLTALGRQISLDNNHDLIRLAQALKSFDHKDYIYTVFTWISPDQKLVVSSNLGVIDKPVDISDRDYVRMAAAEPWKMVIGQPVRGRVSERWVVPVAMGITDSTGKFIGSIGISIDINMLNDQINNLISRNGVSFSILSKNLVPLTAISNDKNSLDAHSPIHQLSDIDLAKRPSGMISQGDLFFGTGSYVYYRASTDYPYIVLLGYEAKYSDESVRNILWSRLLQMIFMASFFVLFLWIARVRMIKPLLDMTESMALIAKGESFTPPAEGGPIEIEMLAAQIHRVSDYIAESKRIESELRNKMFMLKKAKERAEIDQKSKSEFLAYICQEMRIPLNNVVNFAQVMKDQLYGPIENRKYRQYASDIYAAGNALLDSTQDLITMAKAEANHIALTEKPVDVAVAITKAMNYLTEKMIAGRPAITLNIQDPLPRLLADEFRLEQIIFNLISHAIDHSSPKSAITIDVSVINENRDKMFFAVAISASERGSIYSQSELRELAEKVSDTPAYRSVVARILGELNERPDLGLELAKILIALHHGYLDVNASDGSVAIAVFFSGNRIRFVDTQ